ncbi:MAG: DUF3450 domain-containing protein [Myxococcota bacterium]|nr:DUF3450 domain-containing protein [Myxococcota bacterium]
MKRLRRLERDWPAAAFGLVLPLALGLPAGAQLDEAVGTRDRANADGIASQKRIDGLSDETESLQRQYREALRQIEALEVYNRQLAELVASQEEEESSIQEQIDEVELVGRQITPLMLKMIEALAAFVELDVPFLLEERRARVANLEELMGRSDVSEAEKFRRILEAYQIENDYGRTIEAYEGRLESGGEGRTVTFLRVGRLTLVYQTLDGGESGVWDRKQKTWLPLGGEHRIPIRQGLRIARKQAAPDLLRLPVPTAEDAR